MKARRRGRPSLLKALRGLKPHDHICLIYENSKDWKDAVIPFLKVGLERGEKCLYVVDSHTANQIHHFLKMEGIDVESVKQSGQFVILHESEAYTRDGSFDPDRMIALLISETEKALSEGYPALRITGEMTWVLKGHPGSEKLIEYEAKLNSDLFPKHPCVAICQYDRRRFDPEIIKGVILTHPIVIWGKQLYENIYYIPPEEVLSDQYAERQVEHWLSTLERERKTRKGREFLADVIDRASQPIGFGYPDGRVMSFNKALLKLLGYEKSELSKLRWNEHLTPPEWLSGELKRLEELLRTGKPVRYEKEFFRRDGSRVPVELFVELTEDEEGNPFYLAFIADISQRKAQEKAILENEEKFRNIFSQSPIGIELYDSDGKLLDINPACLDIFGVRSIEDVRGFDLFRDPNLPTGAQERLLKGEAISYEMTFDFELVKQMNLYPTEKSGQIFIDCYISPIKGAERYSGGFLVYVRDITKRKRAEEELKKYRDHLEELVRQRTENLQRVEMLSSSVLASLRDHVIVIDRSGQIISVNDAWKRFARENGDPDTASVSIGANYLEVCRQAMRGEEPTAEAVISGIESVLDGSRDKFRMEYDCSSPSEKRWFVLNASPLKGPGGGAVISHTNVTQRKKAEEDLQQLQEELRRVTRIATMGELTAALAHELNQPLTGILSNAQAAQRFLSSQNPDLTELREILSDIVEDDKRASGVILKLRSLFRKEVFELEALYMNDVISEIVPIIRSHALLKSMIFVTELDPDILPVMGDRIQLHQVILNLAFNGFEAMEHSETKKLSVRTGQVDGGWVTVSIEDTGAGIDEKKKEEIFRPFFTTKKDGMGIGLAISYSIIHAHQGKIWIENNPEQGATVSFSLPVAKKNSL
jgi:PAS domain S-box-containing protein